MRASIIRLFVSVVVVALATISINPPAVAESGSGVLVFQKATKNQELLSEKVSKRVLSDLPGTHTFTPVGNYMVDDVNRLDLINGLKINTKMTRSGTQDDRVVERNLVVKNGRVKKVGGGNPQNNFNMHPGDHVRLEATFPNKGEYPMLAGELFQLELVLVREPKSTGSSGPRPITINSVLMTQRDSSGQTQWVPACGETLVTSDPTGNYIAVHFNYNLGTASFIDARAEDSGGRGQGLGFVDRMAAGTGSSSQLVQFSAGAEADVVRIGVCSEPDDDDSNTGRECFKQSCLISVRPPA